MSEREKHWDEGGNPTHFYRPSSHPLTFPLSLCSTGQCNVNRLRRITEREGDSVPRRWEKPTREKLPLTLSLPNNQLREREDLREAHGVNRTFHSLGHFSTICVLFIYSECQDETDCNTIKTTSSLKLTELTWRRWNYVCTLYNNFTNLEWVWVSSREEEIKDQWATRVG